MKTNQILLKSLLTLTTAMFLSACGASSPQSSSDFASRSGTDFISSKPISYCNKSAGSTFSYKLTAQYSNGTYDPNWAHVRLDQMPSGFENDSVILQFFKGYAISDSLLSINSGAISFSLYDLQTGQYLNNAAPYTSLKWNDVKSLITGLTVQEFKNRVMLVLYLADANGQYTVLRAQTATSAGGSPIEMVDALIPAFYANPTEYATKPNGMTRESVLRNMHPLKNQVGDYSLLANQLCQ